MVTYNSHVKQAERLGTQLKSQKLRTEHPWRHLEAETDNGKTCCHLFTDPAGPREWMQGLDWILIPMWFIKTGKTSLCALHNDLAPATFLLHCLGTEKNPKLHKAPSEARGNPTKKKSPKSILQILQRQMGQFWAELEFCRNVPALPIYSEEVKGLKPDFSKALVLVLQSQVSHRPSATRHSQEVDHYSMFSLWHSLMQVGIRLHLFFKSRTPWILRSLMPFSKIRTHWINQEQNLTWGTS